LLGADLTDITEDVRQHAVRRIASLRLLLDAQFGELEFVRFNPGDITGRRFLLNRN